MGTPSNIIWHGISKLCAQFHAFITLVTIRSLSHLTKSSRMQLRLNLYKLHEVVHNKVALRHLIVSLSRNICNLVNANKLSTVSVGMLKEICESLGLNVDDIEQRRKKPWPNNG